MGCGLNGLGVGRQETECNLEKPYIEAQIITYTILGTPCYNYSIAYTQTLFKLPRQTDAIDKALSGIESASIIGNLSNV